MAQRSQLGHFVTASLRQMLVVWFVLAAAGNANAQSRLFLEAAGDVRRPSDVYVIQSEIDPSVCRTILASLNKEYRISDDKIEENPAASVESDSLLGSDLQIPWTRKLVQQPDAQSYKISSLDVAQVKVGDRTINMVRRGLESFSIETGALTINRLWISTASLPSFPSDRPLSAKEAARIKGTEMLVDVSDAPRIEGRKNWATNWAARSIALLNVLMVKDNLYLLAVDAIEAEISAPKGMSGTIDLHILRILSAKDIRPVCRFRST